MRGTGPNSHGSLLGDIAPELAELFVTVACDLCLIVDLDGTIRSVAVGADSPIPSASGWVGRSWADTVSASTRGKIQRLVVEVATSGAARRSEVEHELPSGTAVPMSYSAVRLDGSGLVIAVGRDLRAVAAMQQRFVQTQQRMEREFFKRSDAESRYRMVFQVATDAVLLVDARTGRVVEGNPAAAGHFGLPSPGALAGRDAVTLFEEGSRGRIAAHFAAALAGVSTGETPVRLAGTDLDVEVAVTAFRWGDTDLLRVRLHQVDTQADARAEVLTAFVDRTTDAIAITDRRGSLVTVNPAFASLCGMDEEGLAGRRLDEWLADPGGPGPADEALPELLSEVRSRGSVQRTAAALRAGPGRAVPVALSAIVLRDDSDEHIGFTLRPSGAERP